MVCDHLNTIMQLHNVYMLLIGRFALPLFVYVWAHGQQRSRSDDWPMLIVAFLIQPLYMHLFHTAHLNILFTLATGQAVVQFCMYKRFNYSLLLMALLPLLDYGLLGIAVCLLMSLWLRYKCYFTLVTMLVSVFALNAIYSISLGIAGVVGLVFILLPPIPLKRRKRDMLALYCLHLIAIYVILSLSR